MGVARGGADSERDPDSLLHFFRTMLRAYRGRPELGRGELSVVDVGEPAVLAHTMSWRGRSVLAVHSLSAEPVKVTVPTDVVAVLDVPRHGHLWLGDT